MRGARALALSWIGLVACDPARSPAPAECTRHGQCDDETFCNGEERCIDGACGPGVPVDCDDQVECTTDVCDEQRWSCRHEGADADADGFADHACLVAGVHAPLDCDDANPARYPGASEVCDTGQVDEDCDMSSVGAVDGDGDGEIASRCCNSDGRKTQCGTDCDDQRVAVAVHAQESCDGVDNDCDGQVDETVMTRLFSDHDGDGYGIAQGARDGCQTASGYATRSGDCNDRDARIHPGSVDLCDLEELDQDCNGTPNDPPGGCTCEADAERACPLPGVCAVGKQQCMTGRWSDRCTVAAQDERCNDLDDDCDGEVDEGVRQVCYDDPDHDGFASAGAAAQSSCAETGDPAQRDRCPSGTTPRAPTGSNIDCAKDDATIAPAVTEACNGRDDDCDGRSDEGLPTEARFIDADADGYFGTPAQRCSGDPTSRDRGDDCRDDVFSVHPGQAGSFALPACTLGTLPCRAEDAAWRCRTSVGASCGVELPLASWDYDCDGRNEGSELAAAPCNQGACGASCGPSGFVASVVPACGAPTDYQICRCLGAQGGGCASSLESRPYACR